MQYKVVFETKVKAIEEKVRDLIQDGWEPLGGVSVSESTEENVGLLNRHEVSMSFVQAMIKK